MAEPCGSRLRLSLPAPPAVLTRAATRTCHPREVTLLWAAPEHAHLPSPHPDRPLGEFGLKSPLPLSLSFALSGCVWVTAEELLSPQLTPTRTCAGRGASRARGPFLAPEDLCPAWDGAGTALPSLYHGHLASQSCSRLPPGAHPATQATACSDGEEAGVCRCSTQLLPAPASRQEP